jgi:ATP-dependent helicase/nuclease subunit B
VIERFVVPAPLHVERLAREGRLAETRGALRTRLARALLPDVAFASPRECALALAMALADVDAGRPPGGAQLGLFSAAAAPAAADGTLLDPLRQQGGPSWVRMVAAISSALDVLRARGATVQHLERVADGQSGVSAARARVLATAMRALDARLERGGLRDPRLLPWLLAEAIQNTPADAIVSAVSALRVRARWLLSWEPGDLAWVRALDEKLASAGGFARVVLPSFERRLEATRERDPLEIVAEEVLRGLEAPPEIEPAHAVLGEAGEVDPQRVRLVRTTDAAAQARAAVSAVAGALADGAPVERVAIACPSLDERTLAPLRLALEEADLVLHEPRGAPPSSSPVVSAALLALSAARTLDRAPVARLLRSGYLDAARLLAAPPREAERTLARLARRLETSATADGEDPAARLVRTAAPEGGDDAAAAERIAATLAAAATARTRREHVDAARALWAALGLGARAGRGALSAFARDEPPSGVPRAERLAVARDARAWDALVSAVDVYEATAERVSALDQVVGEDVFRLELTQALDEGASQPGAGRAAAIRILRLLELPGEELDLLVVLDANEGLLPRDAADDALVSEALSAALFRASRGAFVPPDRALRRARELAALAAGAPCARRVVFVFAREDGQGAPLAPSVVVDGLARLGLPVESPEPSPRRAPAESARRRAQREREREAFFLDPARPRSELVGDLAPSAAVFEVLASETGGGDRPLAVTGLERFARCAFMGYAHAVLAARELEAKAELPDAREEGMLVHEALAAAFVATRDLWPRRPRDEAAILARGAAAAEEVLARSQGHAPLRAVARLRLRDSVRAVLEKAIADDAWDFAAAEQPFGARRPGAWSALVLEEEEGGARLALRGTIDRVDRAHDGQAARVVDYKRSQSTVLGAGASLGETALQVPLYARIATRELGVPATGAYLATQPKDLEGARVSPKVTQRMAELVSRAPGEALAPIEQRALALVASVRAGALAPVPAEPRECTLCAVSGGCRKPRFAMAPLDEGDEPA